ncbi:flagellar hook-length control protein FliK [Paenibacillus sp. L3-i20]|uniref:flagellar hook-length control protein FliK n=1 Tax=Paenibacillus sp. L3-i20 TaxID=2905833 RepID=UPI001EDD967F|nr:flagellar hook-length control protein FliK [Paenibacillus sp. L3-i20]GKU78628.1 hypothetical protein L3i20_v230250 [Paenibacillus sp. L3-i20]
MVIPTTAASGQTTTSSSVAGSKQGAGAAGDFQQTLVQQIVGGTGADQQLSESATPVAVITQLGALITLNEDNSELVAEDVLTMIDGLVDSLVATEGDGSLANELKVEDLLANLEQLNALLALLGIPLPKQELTSTPLTEGSTDPDQLEITATAVRSALQNGLLQLQAVMQQGPLKQVQGQEPLSLIAGQLQVLASALAEDGDVQESRSSKSTETAPTWLNVQSTTTKDIGAHLQRLSQQAVHPSLFNVASTAATNQPIAEQGATGGSADLTTAPPVSFVIPDNAREFTPILAKTTATTEFVLADNFAETMNGLIVQKFDIRTLNGFSEAKLILFPEQLGQVDVKISMQNGLLTAVFQADTAMAKDLLDNQMAQLRASLQAQGLTVDKLEVTQSHSASELTHQHPGQGNQGQQSSGNRQGFKDDQTVRDSAFESEMVEQAVIHGLGYGRTINETA